MPALGDSVRGSVVTIPQPVCQPDVRRAGDVRAEALLYHVSRSREKGTGPAENDSMRGHADFPETALETLRPDRSPVAAEDEHLRGVEPDFVDAGKLARQIAREDSPADPVADAAFLVGVVAGSSRREDAPGNTFPFTMNVVPRLGPTGSPGGLPVDGIAANVRMS